MASEEQKAANAKYMREYRSRKELRARRQTELVTEYLAREIEAGIVRAPITWSGFDDAAAGNHGSAASIRMRRNRLKKKLKKEMERQIIMTADLDILQEAHIHQTEWITRKKKVHS